ncbi:MAG: hypothetical protein GF411_12830 [Candidatus Lokiarchaeota archaeon]|nr:hypothetical protein [Candidatus Lokiarchaeota archaeon]
MLNIGFGLSSVLGFGDALFIVCFALFVLLSLVEIVIHNQIRSQDFKTEIISKSSSYINDEILIVSKRNETSKKLIDILQIEVRYSNPQCMVRRGIILGMYQGLSI